MHVRSRTSKKDLEIFEKFKEKNFFDSKEVSDLSKLLPKKKNNILEIGFGDGKNLIEKAKINSDMNFYGVEVFKSGIASVLKQVQIHNLDNVCLFYGDAKDFLVKIEKPFFDQKKVFQSLLKNLLHRHKTNIRCLSYESEPVSKQRQCLT